jgi:glycosyltransferase involved in cell wall biosynthesis
MFPFEGVFIKERITNLVRSNGCDVRVVAPVPYFPPIKLSPRWKFSQVDRSEILDDLQVFHPRFFMTPKIGMSTYGWLMYKSVRPLIKRIRADFDFDLIDAHYMYPDCFAAVLLGRTFQRPVVVSARGSDINLFANFPLIRKLLSYTLKKANHCIAVSQALKTIMVRLGATESKVSVVSNGVDRQKFYPLSREKTREKLGLADDKILLSVGHLIPLKGFDILIRAFKRVIEGSSDRKIRMLIVGSGSSESELLSLVKSLSLEKFVHFVGTVDHSALNLYYNAADIFCLASSREGWPNVLMESLACGTPVIATNVGGIPEILTSEKLGLLTERTANAFADNIRRALGAEWDKAEIAGHAHQFTWENVASSLVRIYESIV